MIRSSRLPVAIGVVSIWAGSVALSPVVWGQASTFEVGQSVEAREGDTWSAVSITAKEGRRYQIRYDDGTEEWVTADRLRAPGGAIPGATSGTPTAEPLATAPPEPAKPAFKIGQKIEFKNGGTWESGQVKQVRSDLLLVEWDRFNKQFHWRWMTPDAVREPGSAVEGPRPMDVFHHTVANSTIPQSYAEAKKELAAHQKKQAQKPRNEAGEHDPFAPPPFAKPVSRANFKDAVTLSLPGSAVEWTAQPDGLGDVAGRGNPIALKAPRPVDVHHHIHREDLVINGGSAVVTYRGRLSGVEMLYAEVVDLQTGRSGGAKEFDFASLPIGVSPSGQMIAARANGFHGGSKYRLDLWKVEGEGYSHVISFVPFPEKRDAWHDITSARFISEDRLLTFSNGREMACWAVPQAKAIWTANFSSLGAWALSPGKQQLAVGDQGLVYLIDVATGNVLGALPNEADSVNRLTFTPDGKRLVGVKGNTLLLWDLERGAFLSSVGLPPGLGEGRLQGVDADHVLVGETLIHIPTRTPVWQYDFRGVTDATFESGRLWGATSAGSQSPRLLSWSLPHLPAKKRSETATPAESVLSQGASVTIDVGGLAGDDATRQAVRDGIKASLEQRNVRVADGQPLRIIGRTEDGKTEQRTYRTMGPAGRQEETVNVTQKISRLSIEVDGQVAWETVSTSGDPGMFVSIDKGQSLSQAVQSASQANVGHFKAVYLPRVVLSPSLFKTLGSSEVSESGITDR